MSFAFAAGAGAPPSDAQLQRALRSVLSLADEQPSLEIRGRSGSPYASSFPLEKLCVRMPDGGRAQLAFKRLQWCARTPGYAKPAFLFDPAREPEVYRRLLPAGPAGPPRRLGSIQTDEGGSWLFIEWVEGCPLHEVGAELMWSEAARWLGQLHAAFAGDPEPLLEQARLLEHDAAYYRRWLARARRVAAAGGRSAAAARGLERLAERYETVVEGLLALPRTVIHGDFHAANILVSGAQGAVRVAACDWELAAVGPGLIDLAALTSGGWGAQERERMIAAYARGAGLPRASVSTRDLDLARLHLAVQWLGWASEWEPPPEQRRDWLADAISIAEGLGL